MQRVLGDGEQKNTNMRMVIVPDSLRNAISAKLDAAIAKCPDAAKDRDELYRQLLAYFDEHGEVPDFDLAKNVVA